MHKTKIELRNLDNENLIRFYLDASFPGVKRLFVLAFNNTAVNVANNTINNQLKNVKLTKQLSEGFKRPAYWNVHKTKIELRNLDNENLIRFYLDASFPGVKRLFVLAFNNTAVNVANNTINNTNNQVVRDKYFHQE